MNPGTADWREAFRSQEALAEDASKTEKAARGRRLEEIFHDMLDEAGLQPRLSYKPSGEELGGSFVMHGRTMLLELKWQKAPQPASTLYQFTGKVGGKLTGTVGLFVSMSGYSADAVNALVVGKEINIVLMDGEDVRAIVDGRIGIELAIETKLRAAAESGTPFVPLTEFTQTQRKLEKTRVVLVEGRLDERIVRLLIDRFGTEPDRVAVIPAGGRANFGKLAQSLYPALTQPCSFVVVTDGDGMPAQVRKDLSDEFARSLPGATVRIVVLDPTIEVVMGLFEPDEFARGRRKVMLLNDDLLFRQLEPGFLAPSPPHKMQLDEFASSLNLRIPSVDGDGDT
ncbi:TOPRIM nucleotidyl transferase/hydrolase domain-containing protein [Serinicoccus profundi]|uniref:TOPRIM nucleotidyl transferase/hydrolase domain-containing protein n=1 Tax=Serinicoccus profundi TaxID=1078471 RepID=UPI000255EC82|nr:TOPRIM nucleotidyl transferase/hydrolase domain-containing protein [Serinicoccus profundi]